MAKKQQEPQSRLHKLNLYDRDAELARVASALSVKTRRDIIRIVNEGPCSVNHIAWKLNIPVSTASFHIKALVDANLLMYSENVRKRGNEKTVSLGEYLFVVDLGAPRGQSAPVREVQTIDIPIGSYTAWEVSPSCGIYTHDRILYLTDTPSVFSSPERFRAGLIWMKQGYLEYSVPLLDYSGSRSTALEYRDRNSIISIAFQFEICSEVAGYNHEYRSDVTFSVNGIEICTICSKGDYGDRRGRLNPDWLPSGDTQYGLLQCVDIRFDGSYLNEERVSDVGIEDLRLNTRNVLTFRIEVKKDARFAGGFNLFGHSFGDYEQDIRMLVTYQRRPALL